MTNEHPITPPPELRQLWAQQAQRMDPHDPVAWLEHVATQAARWGANTELEACCDAIYEHEGQPLCGGTAEWLRAARRPKPPSLKEKALAEMEMLETHGIHACCLDSIRRAIKALPDTP